MCPSSEEGKTLEYLNTKTKGRSRRRSKRNLCFYARSSSLNNSDGNHAKIVGKGVVGVELGF
jgi:hypothetical protein